MSDDAPLDVAVSIRSTDWRVGLPNARALARRAARAAVAAAAPGLADAELSIVLADDAAIRGLNRAWRGTDAPTDVLSFPALDPVPGARPHDRQEPADAPRPLLLGDVVIACATATAGAGRQGTPLADHFCHLVVHGVLHLLGHDHRRAREARAMEGLETAILAGLGIADPHRVTAGDARR